jgi:hypothetical protein
MFHIPGICVRKDVFFNAKKHTDKFVSYVPVCTSSIYVLFVSVLPIRIRIRMLLGHLDPDLGLRLAYGSKDPDPKEIITDTKHSD